MKITKNHFNKMITIPVIFVLISAMFSGCSKSTSNKIADLGARIDEYVNAFNEVSTRQKINGNIFIVRKGEIIFNKSYGMADYENNIPVSKGTVFRLGSTTKLFTALGIMQLYEKGLLDLDDKVSKYIPEQKRGNEITIHQLLTHTSGLIRDAAEYGDYGLYDYTPLDKLVSLIGKRDLIYTPGSAMVYSNAGYELLTYIIEKVSKVPYEEYMKENIFKVANMNNTGVDVSKNEIANLAQPYIYRNEKFNKNSQFNMSYCFGAGNIYSTVYDMYLFDNALMKGKIVSRKTLNKMTSDNTGLDLKSGYGNFQGDIDGHKYFEHQGNIPNGYCSHYIRFPDEDLSIIMLFNTAWDENNSIMGSISSIALGEKCRLPVKRQEISLEERDLKKFVGKYEAPDGRIITIIVLENSLVIMPNPIEIILVPFSKNEFFQRGFEYFEYKFESDKDGKVLYCIQRNSTMELKMKKIK